MIFEELEEKEERGWFMPCGTMPLRDLEIPGECLPENRGIYIFCTKIMLLFSGKMEQKLNIRVTAYLLRILAELLLQAIVSSKAPLRMVGERNRYGEPAKKEGDSLNWEFDILLRRLVHDRENFDFVNGKPYLGLMPFNPEKMDYLEKVHWSDSDLPF